MKKNKSVLLSLIIFSFIFPFFVFAAPAINLGFFSENANSQTGKLDLWLKVNTTDVPNGTIIAVDLFKNGVKDGPTINVPITNNYGEYRSGSVLDPATKYSVIATALGATTTFERTTAGNPVLGVDPPVTVTGIGTTATDSTTYKLLAPIGGLEFAPNNIGEYFNKIFLIAIGLCGALAVIMIVIGGVQYMGDESIFGKTEAKSRIMSAILGLLIALGAYVLLNTINPDLLGGGGVNIRQVSAEILEAPMQQESTGLPAPWQPLGKTNSCPEGYGDVVIPGQPTMHTCKSISSRITTMIQSAKNAGINLSGSSFRSYQDQINTRIANHCPDIYNSPASACKPPTAKPGESMHESGLAIDFKCNGTIIQAQDNACFIWLKNNASTYGLKNFSKEPWHWSTNGR